MFRPAGAAGVGQRIWRCPDQDGPRTTFTEEHPLAGPRAKLTYRAVNWTTDALQHFDISVSALTAHQLGVSWRTVWHGIRAEAARRIADTGRLKGWMRWVSTNMSGPHRPARHQTPGTWTKPETRTALHHGWTRSSPPGGMLRASSGSLSDLTLSKK